LVLKTFKEISLMHAFKAKQEWPIKFWYSRYYRKYSRGFLLSRKRGLFRGKYCEEVGIGKQRALSLDIWPIPTKGIVIGYSCV